jgi:hypothetical protein
MIFMAFMVEIGKVGFVQQLNFHIFLFSPVNLAGNMATKINGIMRMSSHILVRVSKVT